MRENIIYEVTWSYLCFAGECAQALATANSAPISRSIGGSLLSISLQLSLAQISSRWFWRRKKEKFELDWISLPIRRISGTHMSKKWDNQVSDWVSPVSKCLDEKRTKCRKWPRRRKKVKLELATYVYVNDDCDICFHKCFSSENFCIVKKNRSSEF